MFNRMLLRSLVLLALLVNVGKAAAQQLEADVVYEEPELLTKSMLRKHAQLVQLLLDVEYTPEQTAKHYRMVKAYWLQKDHTAIMSVKCNVRFFDELRQLPQEAFRAALEGMRPALLRVLLEEAEVREDARWYLKNYYAAHPMEAGREINTVLTGIIHKQKEEQ